MTHVMNMMISKLTSADIQSTITPDEGRNVPWHMYNIEACDTAKQSLVGMDGLMDMIELKSEGFLRDKVRELQERAVLYLEEMIEVGGYFEAVEKASSLTLANILKEMAMVLLVKSKVVLVLVLSTSVTKTTWLQ